MTAHHAFLTKQVDPQTVQASKLRFSTLCPGADSMALWKQIREIRKVMDEIATEEEWLETQVAGRKDILKARQQLVAL